MKIRNLLFLTLAFLAYGSNVALSANISEDKYYYYVKGVKAEDISANDNETTKKVALDNVKRIAMDALQEKLGENLQLDETNLNSAIGGYKIVDEYYDKDFYSIVADFNFSKIVINSFVKNSKKKDVKLASNTVDAVVVLKEKRNIIDEFAKFREYLRQEQIGHNVLKIRGNEVHIKIYKVSEGTIYDTLKKLNLNGNMYIDRD
ncbi:MAG: hypothetical protein IJT14_02720 [Rickettsiales bacterium]|nr:hypothetical protein [Rickettsiales bacterium]